MATPEEVVTEARELGWVPKEEFRGDETRWVDAATFVERGHTVLPLIKKQKKELEGTVEGLRGEIQRLTQLQAASQESIAALQEFHAKNTKAKVEAARKEIIAELKQAKKDGDTDREVELIDELGQTDRAIAAAGAEEKKEKPSATVADPSLDPALVAWMGKNKWYGTDVRKTALANGIANMLRADPENDTLTGAEFYAEISKELALREKGGRQVDKVNGARHTGEFGGDKKPTYSDLDPEAKKVCDADAKKFVGEGRMFKTVEAWRQYYVDSVLGE